MGANRVASDLISLVVLVFLLMTASSMLAARQANAADDMSLSDVKKRGTFVVGADIPYGVMEEALRSAPALKEEYGLLIQPVDETETSEIAPLLKRLQDLVEKLEVSDQNVNDLIRYFELIRSFTF